MYDDLNNLRYVLPPLASDVLGGSGTYSYSETNTTLGLYGYIFGYDGLNRLSYADYSGWSGTAAVTGTTGLYNEQMSYDKQGNFVSLDRWDQAGKLNQLTFASYGNQLKKVDDGLHVPLPYGSEAFPDKATKPTEYSYDRNGNMTYDGNTGISTIRYNVVNLPDTIQFTAGHENYYTYDATGKKLEVQNITSRNILNLPQDTITRLTSSTKLTTDYCGDAIYQNDTLKEVLTPEGYWQNGLYYYYLKDHQGNTRAVINPSGTVMEYSDYYPDGMRFESSTSNSAALPYRYNGKELEAMNGLNQYNYGARRRETGIPVWTTMDPLAEKYCSISPYAYCAGNPVKYLDPSGGRLVDANENLMYTQRGGWTRYATDDAKRIGNDMMRTETGTKQWNKMANASYPITTTLSSEDRTIDKGNGIKERHFGDSFINATIENGKIEVKKVDFVIYGGTIKTDIKDHPTQTTTMDEKIAIVGGHESVHTTDKTNIEQGIANQKSKKEIYDIEAVPNKVEQQIENEIELQKPPALLPVPIVGIK